MEYSERSALIASKQRRFNERDVNEKQLKKSLGWTHVFVYVVSSIIGAGIYVSPGFVARYTNNMGSSLIIWTISGIVCLIGALCFCELAIALRKTGNQYIFIKETYGNLAGFCAIWTQLLIVYPTAIAVISVTISEHVVEIFAEDSSEEGQWLVRIIAISCCIISVGINCISTAFNSKVQTVLGVVQILGLALFICIGVWKVSTGETQSFRTMFDSNDSGSMDFNSLSLAFVSALFSYNGWGGTVSLNEELHNINRNLKLGIITGMPFVIICFLLFNLALMSMLTHGEMGRSITVATAFIEKSIGAEYAVMVPLIVAFSCLGSLNSIFMSGSRSILSAAREGHLPLSLSFIHKDRCTPIPALLCLLSLSILFILILGSQLVNLLTFYSLGIWLTYIAALFGVIVLRIRRPDLHRPYKVWLIYPILTTIVSCYIIVAPFFKRPIECSICMVILIAAVPVYYVALRCIPKSVMKFGDRLCCWMLDHLPLAECVFEINSNKTASLVKESNC